MLDFSLNWRDYSFAYMAEDFEIGKEMTETLHIFTPQEEAQRLLCASLKAAVKADVPLIRQAKGFARAAAHNQDPRAATYAGELHVKRLEVRARLLVYGFVRGHDWARMEPNHPEGAGVHFQMKWYLKRAWEEAIGIAVDPEARSYITVPEQLYRYEVLKRG